MAIYTDEIYPYSIDIPNVWIRKPFFDTYKDQAFRIGLRHPKGGSIIFACEALDPKTPVDKKQRATLMLEYLRKIPGILGSGRSYGYQAYLVEDNIASCEITTESGEHGLISIIRDNLEYVIQYSTISETALELQNIIFSFRFTNSKVPVFLEHKLGAIGRFFITSGIFAVVMGIVWYFFFRVKINVPLVTVLNGADLVLLSLGFLYLGRVIVFRKMGDTVKVKLFPGSSLPAVGFIGIGFFLLTWLQNNHELQLSAIHSIILFLSLIAGATIFGRKEGE